MIPRHEENHECNPPITFSNAIGVARHNKPILFQVINIMDLAHVTLSTTFIV